ncbi:MAG: DUF3667 domain-containing protein [Bacteroidota bacterium]
METRPHSDFPEAKIERVTTKTMFKSLLAILNLEKGIFYTAWEMIKSPGNAMRRYLFEDRTKFIEPLKFLVLTLPIYIFLSIKVYPAGSLFDSMEQGFRMSAGEDMPEEQIAQAKLLLQYLKDYSNFLLLLTIPISSIWTYLLFRKYRLTFGEHLVLNAFLYAFLTLLGIILMPLGAYSIETLNYLIMLLNFGYMAYFVKDFFRKSWGSSLWNSLVLTVLSFITSSLGLMIIVIIAILLMN